MRRTDIANTQRIVLLVMLVIASAIGTADAGTIASRVLGQPDLFHNSANTVDPQSIVMNNSHGGVAVDPAGHLYVSDQGNNRVLGWHSVSALVNDEPADLVIGQPDLFTGLAPSSTSASSLSGPRGVGVDSAGNVYVADTGDSRVLIFSDPFTTMSQTGQTSGFTAFAVLGQDGDFASGGCDIGNGSSASPETLCSPEDVKVDASNNVYVADTANNRVLEYSAPVNTSTFAANRVFGQLGSFVTTGINTGGISKDSLKEPTGLAIDSHNNLYVVDFGNNRVLEFNTPLSTTMIAGSGDTSADQVWGQAGSFSASTCNNGGVSASSLCFPIKTAVDSSGDLYVSDIDSHRVLEYNESANPPPNLTANKIFGQTTASAQSCNQGANSPTASTLCNPTGLAVDGSGELFMLDGANNRVLDFKNPLSSTTANLVLAEPDFVHSNDAIERGSLSAPKQIAIDPDTGGIVVADNGNHRVLGWHDAETYASGAPADLVIGQLDFYSGQLNVNGGSPTASTLWSPSGVAFDSNGNLYIGDSGNNRVVEYTAPFAACEGAFPCIGGAAHLIFGQASATADSCNAGGNPSATTLCQPMQVAVDSFDNLYVADYGNDRVLEYNTPLTTVGAVTGSGDTTADLVFGQGTPGTGTAFTTSTCNRSLTGLTATSMCNPIGVGVDPSDNVYVSDTTNARILEFNETVSATVAPTNVTANAVFGQNNQFIDNLQLATSASSLFLPYGVGFDAAGNLYAADEGAERVLEYFTPLTSTATKGSGDTVADVVWGQGGNMMSSACNVGGPRAAAATLCGPSAAVVDGVGDVYISDTSNSRITSYAPPFAPPGASVEPESDGILTIEPAFLRFKSTRVGKHRVREVTLTNEGQVAVRIGNLTSLGDFSFLNGCPAQLTPGSSCSIRVTFAPITAGKRGGVLAIGDDARSSPHQVGLAGQAKRRGAR